MWDLAVRAVVPSFVRRRWLCRRWSREQLELLQHLVEHDDFGWSIDGAEGQRPLRLVGGMDISFFADPQSPKDLRAFAALVVCELNRESGSLEVVWERYELVELLEDYIPGFLAFREVEHLRALLEALRAERPDLVPDVILVDGNGVLHPRGLGLASHLGVVCGACTVGIGKDLHLIDGLDREEVKRRLEGAEQGGHVDLVGQSGRTWGCALLPQPLRPVGMKGQAPAKNPIYVSVGHGISLETALRLVKLCCISARVPEPVRLADIRSRERVREVKAREQATADAGKPRPRPKDPEPRKRKAKAGGAAAPVPEGAVPAASSEALEAEIEAVCQLVRDRKRALQAEGRSGRDIKADGGIRELSQRLALLRAQLPAPAAPEAGPGSEEAVLQDGPPEALGRRWGPQGTVLLSVLGLAAAVLLLRAARRSA